MHFEVGEIYIALHPPTRQAEVQSRSLHIQLCRKCSPQAGNRLLFRVVVVVLLFVEMAAETMPEVAML